MEVFELRQVKGKQEESLEETDHEKEEVEETEAKHKTRVDCNREQHPEVPFGPEPWLLHR